MSSNNDAKMLKASTSRGKPYSVYWKTSETPARNKKPAGPIKPVKQTQKKENIKGVANQGLDRPTLRELCPADKQKVRKLIEQLAEAGSERERIEGEMKEERKQFGELLGKLRNQYKKVVQEKTQLQDELHSSQIQHTIPATTNTIPNSSTQGHTPYKLLNVESILSMPPGRPLSHTMATRGQLATTSHPPLYRGGETLPANEQGFPHALLPERPVVLLPSRVAVSSSERSKPLISSIMSSTLDSTLTSLDLPRMGAHIQAQYPNYFPSQIGPSHSHHTHQLPYHVTHGQPPLQHTLNHHQYQTTSSSHYNVDNTNTSLLPSTRVPLHSSLSVTDSSLSTSQFQAPQPQTIQPNNAAMPPQSTPTVSSVSNCGRALVVPLQENTTAMEENDTHVHSPAATGDQSFSVRSWKSLPIASPDKQTATRPTSTDRGHVEPSIAQRDVYTQTLNVESVATQTIHDEDDHGGDKTDEKDNLEKTKASYKHQQCQSSQSANTLTDKSFGSASATLSLSDLQQLPHKQRDSNQPLPSSKKSLTTQTEAEISFIPSTSVSVNQTAAPVTNEGLLEELVTSALLNAQGTLFSLQTLSKLRHGQQTSLSQNSSSTMSKTSSGSGMGKSRTSSRSHGVDKKMRSPSPLELAESLNSHPHTLSLLGTSSTGTRSHDLTVAGCGEDSRLDKKFHRRNQNDDKTSNSTSQEELWTSSSSSQSSCSSPSSDDSDLIEDLFFI